MNRRNFLASALAAAVPARIPAKTVVLTLDDAVKSHRAFVAPLLKDLGFQATFFVTHRWMDDREHFMTWTDIAEIHQMGFEIGNHSWTHDNFSKPQNAARLPAELVQVEDELKKVGVPRPLSFAHCGNNFGPESIAVVKSAGFHFARRGTPPEAKYGTLELGSAYDPAKHHPLLVPTTGDAYPSWNQQQFERAVAQAEAGRACVLQFHGVPDVAHPWVHTPPENFRRYMEYLKQHDFHVLAMRDLERFVDRSNLPDDPMLRTRYPSG